MIAFSAPKVKKKAGEERFDTVYKQLLRFLSNIRLSEHEQYATAKENCRLLFEQFDLSETVARSVDEKFGNRDRSGKSRMLLKKDAIRILDALVRFDDTGELDAEVLNDLEKYDFGDILYSSDRLEELLNDDVLPDRTVLLFTVLAQNCGMKYDPETNTLEESDDLTDIPSFNEYYSKPFRLYEGRNCIFGQHFV